jgi:death-on-curing protein
VIEPYWLDLHDVCAIHGEILAESGGAAGVLLEGAIESTLHKAKNLYYYSDRKATLYQLASTYGYGFAKNHCFVDGNKRVALIVVYTFLSINGIELTASEVDAASCFLDLAASMETQEACLQTLSDWLQENSEQILAQE